MSYGPKRETLLRCGYSLEEVGIGPEEAEAIREILREIALDTYKNQDAP